LIVSLLLQPLPGSAQQGGTSVRYAFADTTLLRDTLGLHFDRLFPVADSLQLAPDTVRALMVRYVLTMPRLLQLSDSLGMTVDSVGPYLFRERFNPLARNTPGGAKTHNDFTYTSGYDIQRTSTTWTNGSTYRLDHGPTYVTNVTNIELQRIQSGATTSLRQNREATTETGLTVSKGLSFGARSYQLRFFSADPGSPVTQDEVKSEYGFTSRAAAKGKLLSSELNVRSGYLDDRNATNLKRGLSGTADARVRYNKNGVLTHDLSGSVTGNLSHSRIVTSPLELATHDLSSSLRGNLVVLPNAPVRFNLNYGLRNSRVETPLDSVVNRIIQNGNNADGTLRFRVDNDRYLDLGGSVTNSTTQSGTAGNHGGKATLRWTLLGWAIDGNYGDTRDQSVLFRRQRTGGYTENGVSRSADATMARNFFDNHVIARIQANIGLDRYRYLVQAGTVYADSVTPPSPRDAYTQSFRTEFSYNPSLKLTSRVAGQVLLNRTINILAATTASNTDTRTYRGEWSWSYKLFKSLAVTQNNQLQADYLQYPFANTRNTLSLNYANTTSLSAALPGNLQIDIAHTATQTPRGSYTIQDDGLNALQLSDNAKNYGLSGSVRYAISSGLSLHVEPRYSSIERLGTVNGVQARQRSDKRLDFAGGVDLNLHVLSKGTLTGRLSRTYSDQRTINYKNDIPDPTPRSETDFWNGNLQLTWTL
jgi:hypothetical protein